MGSRQRLQAVRICRKLDQYRGILKIEGNRLRESPAARMWPSDPAGSKQDEGLIRNGNNLSIDRDNILSLGEPHVVLQRITLI